MIPGVFAERGNAGTCAPLCDPLAQDCPNVTDACYASVFVGMATCVDVQVEGLQGDACTLINGCAKGYGCVLPVSPTDSSRVCAFFCDPTGTGGPTCADGPGGTYECRPINSIHPNTALSADIGMCLDPQIFP